MDTIFKMLSGNPLLIVIIIAVVACFVIPGIKKKKDMQNGSQTANKSSASEEIGYQDEVVKPHDWYRTQAVTQPVVKRTDEQQQIIDEYFIIRNYKTTSCKSEYKRKQKKTSVIAKILLAIGGVIAIISFVNAGSSFELAIKDTWFIIGLIGLAVGAICLLVAMIYKKKFEASIKHTIAPKKVMTDSEYEALVNKKIESMNIEQLGLEKLGLDPDQVKEIRPIILRDKVINKDYSFTVRNSVDYSLHSSTQHVTYLYFTDEQLFVYKVQFDMCCNIQDEYTSEFFYKDICDVSSHTSRNILKYEDYQFEYSTVTLDIIATNSEIGFVLDGDNENVGSIQAMKQKIREKKAQ